MEKLTTGVQDEGRRRFTLDDGERTGGFNSGSYTIALFSRSKNLFYDDLCVVLLIFFFIRAFAPLWLSGLGMGEGNWAGTHSYVQDSMGSLGRGGKEVCKGGLGCVSEGGVCCLGWGLVREVEVCNDGGACVRRWGM